ncbi:MAG: hypothetical protein ACREBP_02310, partial [Sphingomicrobium sp.]
MRTPTTKPVTALTIQFLTWVASRPRTRSDVMDAWRSTCPMNSVWEDAVIEGLVSLDAAGNVALTSLGQAALDRAAHSGSGHD